MGQEGKRPTRRGWLGRLQSTTDKSEEIPEEVPFEPPVSPVLEDSSEPTEVIEGLPDATDTTLSDDADNVPGAVTDPTGAIWFMGDSEGDEEDSSETSSPVSPGFVYSALTGLETSDESAEVGPSGVTSGQDPLIGSDFPADPNIHVQVSTTAECVVCLLEKDILTSLYLSDKGGFICQSCQEDPGSGNDELNGTIGRSAISISNGPGLDDSPEGVESLRQEETPDFPVTPQAPVASANAKYFVIALGGTGVQIVDQFKRSEYNGIPSLFSEGGYHYALIDTSGDLEASNPGYSHTADGDQKWLHAGRQIRLAFLNEGAQKIPPIAEFVGEHSLQRYINRDSDVYPFYRDLYNSSITFLVHSASGGTGGGLGPYVAKWLEDNGNLGNTRISMVSLGLITGAEEADYLFGNALYNFPKINENTEMVVLIDNEMIRQKSHASGNGDTDYAVPRYMEHIETNLLKGLPSYLGNRAPEYIVPDRYSYRIMGVLTRLENDVGDMISHFKEDTYYNQGARWLVPYVYPLDRDYEVEYKGVPPAYLALRAIHEGALCEVDQDNPHGTKAVVLFEAPRGYHIGSHEAAITRAVSEALRIPAKDVVLKGSTSPVDGVAVTVLWLHPMTKFLQSCCDLDNESQAERKNELTAAWRNRVRSAGNESEVPSAATIPPSWASVCQGVARMWATNERASRQEIARLRRAVPIKIKEHVERDICDEFLVYARRTGML